MKVKVKELEDLVDSNMPTIPTCLLKLSISQEEIEVDCNGSIVVFKDLTQWSKNFFVFPKTFEKDQKVNARVADGWFRRYYSHFDGKHHHCYDYGSTSWSNTGHTFIAEEVTDVL